MGDNQLDMTQDEVKKTLCMLVSSIIVFLKFQNAPTKCLVTASNGGFAKFYTTWYVFVVLISNLYHFIEQKKLLSSIHFFFNF